MPVRKQTIDVADKSERVRHPFGFRFRRLIGALLVLLILLISLAILLHRSLLRAYAPTILDQLASQFETFYDMQFLWDGYSISELNDFTISGITLTDIPSGSTFLQVDSMRVRTSLMALAIRGQNPVSGITSVELANPIITAGRRDGRWNTGKLFEPGDGEPYQFPGRLGIIVRDGVVEWLGGEIADGVTLPPVQIAGLQGVFRLGSNNSMGLNLDGTFSGTEIEPTSIGILGSYDPETYLMQLNASVDALDLSILQNLADDYQASDISGFAGIYLSVLAGPDTGEAGYSILGRADLSEAGVTFDTYAITARDIGGELHFSHKSIFTSSLTGDIDGATLTARGHLGDFGSSTVGTDLVIEGSGVRTATVKNILPGFAAVPLDGSLNFKAELTKSASGIDVIVSADSSSLSYMNYPFALNNILAWYSGEKFVVNSVNAEILGGSVTGDGIVDFTAEEPSYEFRVAAAGIPSAQFGTFLLPNTPGLFPDGTFAADASVYGAGSDPPVISGVAFISDASIPDNPAIPRLDVTIPFSYDGRKTSVSEASATATSMSLLAQGDFQPSTGFDGSVALTIEDPLLIGNILDLPFNGSVALAGDISWSQEAGIGFDGDTVITDASYGPVVSQNLSFRLAYADDIVRIDDISGLVNSGVLTGQIAIPLAEGKTGIEGIESGSFRLTGFDAARVIPAEYANLVSTSLDITGDLGYIADTGTVTVDMNIREDSAQFGPNTISTEGDGLIARLEFPMNNLGLSSIVLDGLLNFRPETAPIYQGRILTPYAERIIDQVTDLLTGQESEAPQPQPHEFPAIAGPVRVAADLSGLFGQLNGSVDITATDLNTYGINFDSAALNLDTLDGAMWNLGLTVDTGEMGRFLLNGTIINDPVMADSAVNLNASVIGAGIDPIFAYLGLGGTGNSTGSISGEGNIEGTIANPVIDNFSLNVDQAETFGIPLEQGTATFSFDSPVLNVTGLDISGTSGFHASGMGSLDLSEVSLTSATMVFRVDDFNLQAIALAMGTDFPIEGMASGVVMLALDALGPKIIYNATVEQLVYHSLLLGNIRLNAVYYPGDPQIRISGLELDNGSENFRLSGMIPVNFRNTIDELFDLSIDSDTGYSIPPINGPGGTGIAWDGGLGPVHLTLIGSIQDPVLDGTMNIDLRNVRLGDYLIADSIGGPVTATHSVVTVDPLTFQVRNPDWTLGIDGSAWILNFVRHVGTVAEFSLRTMSNNPIRLAGTGFEVNLRPGEADAAPKLRVTYDSLELKYRITGNISVLGGRVDIARLPQFVPPDPGIDIPESPFSFDLMVSLLAGLRVQSGNMLNSTIERGEINLTGNFAYPVLVGSLTAPEGWIDLFGNHFVFIEPLVITLSSIYPPSSPFITATGRTNLRQSSAPGASSGELAVTVRINGRLRSLQETQAFQDEIESTDSVLFTSEPPMSQDSIIAALAWEDFYVRAIGGTLMGDSSMSSGFDNMSFGGTVLPFATAYLSNYIRREAGFSDFEVSLDRNENVLIYLEKEIFNNVVMYYSQTFGQDEDNQYYFGTRYRWRPRSWVGLEVDSDNDVTAQVEYIIPID